VIVFLGVYTIGDPLEILLPGDATLAEREPVAKALNLNDPLPGPVPATRHRRIAGRIRPLLCLQPAR
jgi:hypothetical protein